MRPGFDRGAYATASRQKGITWSPNSGTLWKFLRLQGQTAWIDYDDYYIIHVGAVLAVFQHIFAPYIQTTAPLSG